MIRILATVLTSYSAYSFWAAHTYETWGYTAFGAFSLVTAITLWVMKPWSKYLMYIWGSLLIGSWVWALIIAVQKGWPYEGMQQTIISLI